MGLSDSIKTRSPTRTVKFGDMQGQLLAATINFLHRHIKEGPQVYEQMDENWVTRLFYEKQYHDKEGLSPSFIESVDDCSVVHISSFILSILHQGIFGVSGLIISVFYLSRFNEVNGTMLHMYTWRPLFITALLLADKMWEDKPMRTSSLSKLFPVLSNAELLNLEETFLCEIGFRLMVLPGDFVAFCEQLLTENVDPQVASCVGESEYFASLGGALSLEDPVVKEPACHLHDVLVPEVSPSNLPGLRARVMDRRSYGRKSLAEHASEKGSRSVGCAQPRRTFASQSGTQLTVSRPCALSPSARRLASEKATSPASARVHLQVNGPLLKATGSAVPGSVDTSRSRVTSKTGKAQQLKSPSPERVVGSPEIRRQGSPLRLQAGTRVNGTSKAGGPRRQPMSSLCTGSREERSPCKHSVSSPVLDTDRCISAPTSSQSAASLPAVEPGFQRKEVAAQGVPRRSPAGAHWSSTGVTLGVKTSLLPTQQVHRTRVQGSPLRHEDTVSSPKPSFSVKILPSRSSPSCRSSEARSPRIQDQSDFLTRGRSLSLFSKCPVEVALSRS